MEYLILYDPRVEGDLKGIDHPIRKRILKIIKQKLAKSPKKFGKRLKRELRNYWSLRIGDYRVIYRIREKEVIVLVVKIAHRSIVYKHLLREIMPEEKRERE